MTSDWIADDDRLFEALRASLESAGAVPPDVVAAAKEVFGLRYVDEEFARLTYDSQADAELVGAFRSETLSLRSLVFGLGEITLDIDVLPIRSSGRSRRRSPVSSWPRPARGRPVRARSTTPGCSAFR